MSENEKKIALIAVGPVWIFLFTYVLELLSFSLTSAPIFPLSALAIISSAFLPRVLFYDRTIRLSIFTVLASLSLIAICFCISSLINDTSFDGQTYHQLAVDLLRNGWNPISNDHSRLSSLKPEYQLPLYHYPKFPWLVEAVLYGVTKNIEGAKCLNLVLLISSGLLAYLAALKLNFTKSSALLVASALALNPVSICQLWTSYIDGLLGSMSLFIFAALGLYLTTRKIVWIHIAGLALIILLHIKFTAIVIIGSLFVVLFVGAVRKSADCLKLFKILFLYLLVGGLVIGWHPYVTNILVTGNPIYPVAGYSPIGKTPPPNDWPIFSLVNGQQPEKLKNLPGPLKTIFSLSSRVSDPLNINENYQFFWNGSPKDFSRFIAPDLRLGGFGPLFAIVFLISLLGLSRFKNDAASRGIVLCCAVIILSSLLNPESWWSRYSPQLWLLPILFALASKHLRVLQTVSLLCITSSLVILFVNTSAAVSNSKEVNNTLSKLEPFRNSTLPGETLSFYSNDLRLKNLNITLTSPTDCTHKTYFAGSPSYVCLPLK
jgi:hypothetical protein